MIPMREIGYIDYVKLVENKSREGRFPIEGSIELTFRCVLRCKHCYTACNQYPELEMSAQEWCRLLDEAAQLGMLELLITGGDPMLRGDVFKTVYSHAKSLGLWVTVFTSGNLINETWARFFADAPPQLIEITLYGATEKTYESVTRVKGSYKRCMNGLDWLEKYKVPYKLKTAVLNDNKHELHACRKIALERGQKAFRYDAELHPKLNGTAISLDARITPKEIVELDLVDPVKAEAIRKQFSRPLTKRAPDELRNFHCAAGKADFFCNPYGKLQVCTLIPKPEHQYEWRHGGSLKEAFYEFFPKVTNSRPQKAQRCHPCNLWDVCEGCAGWSSTVHGDLETPVDFMCEVTHRRAMAFGTDPKLFSHSMMYKKIMEGKTFPETKVPEEGFHGTGGITLPSLMLPSAGHSTQKSSCQGEGCCSS